MAYARRMQGRANPFFLSLASAVEIIHDMGFEADYFVSESWSCSHINAWNRELAIRVGLLLEEVRPVAVVFDGTWPFHGFMAACDNFGVGFRVWSNRGMHKSDFRPVPVDESAFDLVIQPGEIGALFSVERAQPPGRKVTTQPVTLLKHDELLARDAARDALGLERDRVYALFSLGNFKGDNDIASGLIDEIRMRGFTVVWARTPISVADIPLPKDVISISVYPLVRYMRAFDIIIGAAGYNTCCEVVQSAVPSLLVPNPMAADNQARRAELTARHAPVVVFNPEICDWHGAVSRLLELCRKPAERLTVPLNGAERAADEILSLIREEVAV